MDRRRENRCLMINCSNQTGNFCLEFWADSKFCLLASRAFKTGYSNTIIFYVTISFFIFPRKVRISCLTLLLLTKHKNWEYLKVIIHGHLWAFFLIAQVVWAEQIKWEHFEFEFFWLPARSHLEWPCGQRWEWQSRCGQERQPVLVAKIMKTIIWLPSCSIFFPRTVA